MRPLLLLPEVGSNPNVFMRAYEKGSCLKVFSQHIGTSEMYIRM